MKRILRWPLWVERFKSVAFLTISTVRCGLLYCDFTLHNCTAQGQQSIRQLLDGSTSRAIISFYVFTCHIREQIKGRKQHTVTYSVEDSCSFTSRVVILHCYFSVNCEKPWKPAQQYTTQFRNTLSSLPGGVCLCWSQRGSVTCPVCHLLSLHPLSLSTPLSLLLC